MSENETETPTQHAMLVIWGQFAQAFGMIQAVSSVPVDQKTVDFSPHTKILEFFLAILGGLEHLQELNTAAEPIVKDAAVAKAWAQPGWAHHSGVSRTLTSLTQAQAEQIVQALERLEQPFIDREVMLALASQGELILDGDLTARPVSDTSTDYPEAAFGHMDENKLGLGYQSAQVSLQTPTYGRLLLSSRLHPGDMVSNAQRKSWCRPLKLALDYGHCGAPICWLSVWKLRSNTARCRNAVLKKANKPCSRSWIRWPRPTGRLSNIRHS